MTNKEIAFTNTIDVNKNIDMNRIFDAFYTTNVDKNSNQKSHGLGLYFVMEILKQHHLRHKCFVDNNCFYFGIKTTN